MWSHPRRLRVYWQALGKPEWKSWLSTKAVHNPRQAPLPSNPLPQAGAGFPRRSQARLTSRKVKHMPKKDLSRRNFIKSASAATAAALGGSPRAASQEMPGDCGSVWEKPSQQAGNNLNLILLVSDTFRRDNLECYGSQWIECPNLNSFARDAIIFEDFYPEGMPTIPIRRTLWTGRRILPFHYYRQPEPVQLPGWHSLYNEDVTLSETLLEAGYIPALIADLPHLQRPGRNFHRGYRVY